MRIKEVFKITTRYLFVCIIYTSMVGDPAACCVACATRCCVLTASVAAVAAGAALTVRCGSFSRATLLWKY